MSKKIIFLLTLFFMICLSSASLYAGEFSKFRLSSGLTLAAAEHPASGEVPSGHEAVSEGGHDAHKVEAHHEIPVWMVIPFVVMLLSIAVLPLIAHHWWENNSHRAMIAFPLGFLAVGLLFWKLGGHEALHKVEHTFVEYLQFIIMLGSLYIISGGIVLRGDLRATPKVNTTFLAIGGLIASFVGTTGASMLLIRAVLKTVSERQYKVHTVIFFIFIVSNIGGCLTPLGDPPLFLGFLKGVPFAWTFGLWKDWAFSLVILLIVYFIWDSILYKKEAPSDKWEDKTHIEPLRLDGSLNFLFLGGVICAVAFSGVFFEKLSVGMFGVDKEHGSAWLSNGSPWREIIMAIMVFLSLSLTNPKYRADNKFTYGPIIEVAVLFVGIFLTMIPALMILEVKGGSLGVNSPAKFFWVTGALSSFLDNAPTYLVFFQTAQSMHMDPSTFGAYVAGTGIPELILKAISLGAVFMGANTYIGNGPNFMVKAVAEESGVKMPSFFGYMMYSVLILIPLFLLITLLSWLTPTHIL